MVGGYAALMRELRKLWRLIYLLPLAFLGCLLCLSAADDL